MRQKGPTGVIDYDFLSLESSMVYHLIYHHSLALHLNHLLLLNTYLFGVFLAFAGTGLWPILAAVAGLYATYAVALTRCVALPYAVVVGGLASAAWFVVDAACTPESELRTWHFVGVGVGVVLVSLLLQLAGHAAHEHFQAPPLLKHGFVSAPVLEYMSLVFRMGLLPDVAARVHQQVDRARADAGPLLHGPTNGRGE